METNYQKVIEANIALHTKMSNDYSTCEPHFRNENVTSVESKVAPLMQKINAKNVLDLGCGTGFMINIVKKYAEIVHGVDVTQAMMDKVDKTGNAKIELFNHDTGSFPVQGGFYDLVTAYSFLHHLYDVVPTLKTAFNGLREGGLFYADLDPNYYFWEGVNALERDKEYDEIVKREIEMVTYKDEDIEKNFSVDKDVFNAAEYGKNIKGGFKEDELVKTLKSIGFKKVTFFYNWFIGQGLLINNDAYDKEKRFEYADVMNTYLQKALPLSKNLFKYIGFVAEK
jgi:SAM-dependent methyltransferase